MLIQELMTSAVQSVTPDTTIMDAACKMRDQDIGTLAVIDNNELIGILTDRDICCRCISEGLDPTNTDVSKIMTDDVASCFGDQVISDAVQIMEEMQIRRVAVINHDDSIAGMLSVDDLAKGSHDLAGEVLEATTPIH